MPTNIFNRIEQKYLLTRGEYEGFIYAIKDKIEKDEYFESNISNIYFDNDRKDLIINSIEKENYKHKVRLRSYFVPTENDDVYLEVKSKYNGIVNKRRIKLKLKDFNEYMNLKNNKPNRKFNTDNQIFKEIDYLFDYYKLKPFCFLAYDRKSFKGLSSEDKQLRITFDFNLRSRYNDLHLENGNEGEKFFGDKDYIIMEVKAPESLPL